MKQVRTKWVRHIHSFPFLYFYHITQRKVTFEDGGIQETSACRVGDCWGGGLSYGHVWNRPRQMNQRYSGWDKLNWIMLLRSFSHSVKINYFSFKSTMAICMASVWFTWSKISWFFCRRRGLWTVGLKHKRKMPQNVFFTVPRFGPSKDCNKTDEP